MKLSVAVCIYNGAHFIEEQLLSIIQQELPVNEIVVCDDGSKDASLEIVNNLAASHPEIIWIIQQNESNLGVTKNFEKAISLCTGDVIFLSDQDDVWRADKTKVISKIFTDFSDVNVIFTDANLIDEEGTILSQHSLLDSVGLWPNISLWNDGFQLEMLNQLNKATGATMAIRKSFWNFARPLSNDKKWLHDVQLAMVGCLTNSLYLLPERLISYRQHNDNAIGVKKTNWIFTGVQPPKLLPLIIDPYPVNEYMWRFSNPRLRFYEKRRRNHLNIRGKLLLALSFFQYLKYYRRHAFHFYIHDLKCGLF